MEKEKLQHYSIRKLSVGAASVLIGLSFVGMGRTTQVKADTVNENQQQVVKTQKVENTSADTQASPDNTQASDSKSNLNNDQTQSNEKATNVTSTTVSRKSVLGSEQLNASSETQNETPDNNNSKAATTLRTSENEEKVVENNKNKVETTTLNLDKTTTDNSAATLSDLKVETQSANDTSSLPAFGSASLDDRALGTRHTAVGDTRSNYDKTAISSDIQLTPYNQTDKPYTDGNIGNFSITKGNPFLGLTGTATLNKDDIKKDNQILLGTIQFSNNRYGQAATTDNDANEKIRFDNDSYLHAMPVIFQNQNIGNIAINYLDNNEVDLVLSVANSLNFATNPEISFNNIFFGSVRFYGSYPALRGMKAGDSINEQLDTGSHKYTITANYVDEPNNYNVTTHIANTTYAAGSKTDLSSWQGRGIYPINDYSRSLFDSDSNGNIDPNNITLKDNGEWDFAEKFSFPTKDLALTVSPNSFVTDNYLEYEVDANNKLFFSHISSNWLEQSTNISQKADNLSAKDLLDQTEAGQFSWSRQSDGSFIVAGKMTKDNLHKITAQEVGNLEGSSDSYTTNIQDPDHASEIIANTESYYAKNPYSPVFGVHISFNTNTSEPLITTASDVTPRDYSQYVLPEMVTVTSSDGANTGSFNAELYRTAKVNYVDDSDNENIINTDSITGRKNIGTDYTINIPTGYILASDNADGTNYKWNDGKTGLTYTFADDQTTNDANPVTIHLTHGRKNLVRSKVVAETIHYQYENGTKAADDYEAKHVVLDQTGYKDLVTGETVWDGDWSTGEFPEVASPKINGYTANPTTIDAVNVDSNTDDVVRTVTYIANDQKIFVNYIDDDNNGSIIHTDPLVGKSNTDSGYTTKDEISDLASKGYDLVSDETNGAELKYDADDTKDQTYSVHLKHHISDVTDPAMLTSTFDRVITEKLPSGQNKQITQHYEVHRTGTQDQVTKAYKFGNWSTAQVHEDKGDKLDGYTARISKQSSAGLADVKEGVPTVKAETFSGVNNGSTTPVNVKEEIEVSYDANTQKATINFIDDNAQEGTNNVLQSKDLTGKSNTKASYDTGADIEKYLSQGYLLVSDDTQGNPITFDEKDNEDQVYNVHLKHNIVKVTDPRILTATFDRVVTETLPDGKDKQITQHYEVHRTGTQDQVTKAYKFGNWSTAQVHEDKGDTFEGYTPHLSGNNLDSFISLVDGTPIAKAETFTNENGKLLPKNVSEKVDITYTSNSQEAAIVFYDDTADTPLQKNTVRGHYGEAIEFTPKVSDVITEYTKKGYVLVSNEFDNQKYAADDKQNVFVVHLKHGTVDVTRSKDVTETIHYVYDNNSKAHDDYVATKKFDNHGIKDLVTGETKWDTNWTPESDKFAQVNSPEIPGYTADKTSIPAQTVNADSKNLEYTVTYTQTPAPTPYEPSDTVQPVQPTQPDVQPSTPVVPDQPVDQDDSNKSESTPTKKVVRVKKNKTVSDSLVNNSVSDRPDNYLPSDYGNYVAKDESTDVQSPKVVARGSLPKTTEVKSNAKELPTTGAKDEDQLSYVGLALAGLVGMFGYSIKKRKD